MTFGQILVHGGAADLSVSANVRILYLTHGRMLVVCHFNDLSFDSRLSLFVLLVPHLSVHACGDPS